MVAAIGKMPKMAEWPDYGTQAQLGKYWRKQIQYVFSIRFTRLAVLPDAFDYGLSQIHGSKDVALVLKNNPVFLTERNAIKLILLSAKQWA